MAKQWCAILTLLTLLPMMALGVVKAQEPQTLQRSPVQRAAIRALSDLLSTATIAMRPSILTDPTDRMVTAEFAVDINGGPATIDDQVTLGVCNADAVVIGTLSEAGSFLSDRASFILTSYDVLVQESLKGGLSTQSTVSYIRPGGQMMVDGRTVRTQHELYPELETGTSYLLFLRQIPAHENTFTVLANQTWLVNAISMGETAIGDSPWSIRALKAGASPDEVRAAALVAECAKRRTP